MNVNKIEELCANIASSSEKLEKSCNTVLDLLNRMQFRDDQEDYDCDHDCYEENEEHFCSGCMDCLDVSWKDFI